MIKTERMKTVFALLVIVAIAGISTMNIEPALASNPKYLTLSAGEDVSFDNVGHVCNWNYVLYGDSGCRMCAQRAYFIYNYSVEQMYCTPKVHDDCAGYDVCYCTDNPELCQS